MRDTDIAPGMPFVTSSPWYRAEREAAAELIKIQSEKLAESCAATPDRFVAFATTEDAGDRAGVPASRRAG